MLIFLPVSYQSTICTYQAYLSISFQVYAHPEKHFLEHPCKLLYLYCSLCQSEKMFISLKCAVSTYGQFATYGEIAKLQAHGFKISIKIANLLPEERQWFTLPWQQDKGFVYILQHLALSDAIVFTRVVEVTAFQQSSVASSVVSGQGEQWTNIHLFIRLCNLSMLSHCPFFFLSISFSNFFLADWH